MLHMHALQAKCDSGLCRSFGKLRGDNSQKRGFVVPDSDVEDKKFRWMLIRFLDAHHHCCNASGELSKGTGNIDCYKEYSDPHTRDCCIFYQAADFGEDAGCWPCKLLFVSLLCNSCRNLPGFSDSASCVVLHGSDDGDQFLQWLSLWNWFLIIQLITAQFRVFLGTTHWSIG